ncbi:MAG TPA: ABC transporter permease [Acidisoma sp.]|nr:ABC transporter permease [Acidisoma sp.]
MSALALAPPRTSLRLGQTVARSGFAVLLLVFLLILNVSLYPGRFAPSGWGTVIGLAAPLIGAAFASTPALLGGRGGIDVSVGPAMGFVNAIVIKGLVMGLSLSSPWLVVPMALALGGMVGAFNGLLAAVIRIQPIIATLGSYLILTGLTLTILPSPMGVAPAWLKALAGPWAILPVGFVFVTWLGLRRLPFYDCLMATGSDDRAAYTAGVPVTRVRFLSYVLTGVYAGAAGLMLTALIGSADPATGPSYTLIAISAVALGGVSFRGGRGGLINAGIGAIDIFLLQSVLTYLNVSSFVLQIGYGAILVLAVVLTAVQERLLSRRSTHGA